MMDKVSPVTFNFHQKEVSGRYLIISLFTTYIMFLYEMVDHFTMRTYGVNQTFRFVLNAFGYIERVVKSEFFFRKRPILHHTCAKRSELPSYISTMTYPGPLSYK